MAEVLDYSPALEPIANLEQLGRGIGSPYLECIRSHTGQLIAKQWIMIMSAKRAAHAEVVIRFPHARSFGQPLLRPPTFEPCEICSQVPPHHPSCQYAENFENDRDF